MKELELCSWYFILRLHCHHISWDLGPVAGQKDQACTLLFSRYRISILKRCVKIVCPGGLAKRIVWICESSWLCNELALPLFFTAAAECWVSGLHPGPQSSDRPWWQNNNAALLRKVRPQKGNSYPEPDQESPFPQCNQVIICNCTVGENSGKSLFEIYVISETRSILGI